jgi:hypothetical protein
MKFQFFHIVLFLFIPVLMTVSCVDESSSVGGKWVDSSFRNVLTDTCTVHLSTILADSISTSGDSICQIGHYADKYRGSIRGSFFTEYNVPKTSFAGEVIYAFDSITVSFRPSGDYLGDTLSTRQKITIHRMTENLDITDYLYNTSSAKYEETPFASVSFWPLPNGRRKFEVRLPDELGQEFFDLMYNQALAFDSQDHFRRYFPGLAFLPDTNDNCVTGFAVNDSSMCLTMYYRKMEAISTDLTISITPNSTYRFNKAGQDFTGTPFEDIKPGVNEAMSSAKSENVSCLQGLTGAYTKIEFPYLNNLLYQGELVTIESAILYLYPVQEAYGDFTPLPGSLTLYTANGNDIADGVITDSSGEVVQDGSLVKDDPVTLTSYYSFDITSYMQTNLGTIGINRQNLMLMLPNEHFLTTMEGLVLGDMNHPTDRVKLSVLYKAYNP